VSRSALVCGVLLALITVLVPAAPALAAAPTVTGLSAATGPPTGGTVLTVSGTGFAGALNSCSPTTTVAFGAQFSHPETAINGTGVQVLSDTQIRVTTPATSPGNVDVVVTNMCGTSAPNPTDRFFFDQTPHCTTSCSALVDATSVSGSVRHSAAGLLHAPPSPPFVLTAPLRSQLAALDLRFWRVSSYWNRDTIAHELGVPTIELISDDWLLAHYGVKPWDNLVEWRAFVTQLVSDPSLQPVAYWDILNEPGGGPFGGGGPAQYLAAFDVAYDAIKAVNPTFKVVAPSIGAFADDGNNAWGLDLKTFADHAQMLGQHWDAISWHEISDMYGTPTRLNSPRHLIEHVNRARGLLSSHAVLAGAKIFMTEYATTATRKAPGWTAGNIAALEEAQVDEANRACWGIDQTTLNECDDTFNALFGTDNVTPQPNYWVYRRYADHTGTRIGVSSASLDLSGLATLDVAGTTVRALIGRHIDCGAANPMYVNGPGPWLCPNGTPSQMAGSTSMTVTIKLPPALASRSSVQVTVEKIPNQTANLPSLTSTTLTLSVSGGQASTTVTMADGDAVALTITG
jgi:hypothetical protein